MKKIVWTVIIIFILVIIGAVFNKPGKVSNDKEIKVGFILPLSGDFAVIGEELKKGADLAIDQLDKQGVNITAVYFDDQFDPKQAASGANKLISIDKVNFAALFSVEEARPTMPIFNASKVPLLSLWDSNDLLKSAGPYIYSNGFSTEKAGSIMADYAFNILKLKKVAIIRHIDQWSEIISQSFEEQFKRDGGEIVYRDQVQIGTDDFRLIISKIKNANPDGIYMPLIPFDSVSFINQVRQLGVKVPLMSGDALIQDVISAVGAFAEGIYFTNAYTDSTELGQLYKDKYGQDASALVWTASAYDGIMKVGQALNEEEDIKVTLDKVFGPNRSTDRIEKIYQVINGVPVEVK